MNKPLTVQELSALGHAARWKGKTKAAKRDATDAARKALAAKRLKNQGKTHS